MIAHGNAGNVSNRGPLMLDLSRACRAAAFVFDYPGYGRSAGRPTEPGCYAAADAAYDWLVNEKKFPPGRILLVGESLGGGVAVDLARRREHRALVLFNALGRARGFEDDPGRRWSDFSSDFAEQFWGTEEYVPAVCPSVMHDPAQTAWWARYMRATATPQAIAAQMRVMGMTEGGEEGLVLLGEAVEVLSGSPAKLEHAKARVELGAALRRANARSSFGGARARRRARPYA